MDDDVKRKLILVSGIICIVVILYIVFVGGASYSCNRGGGDLVKNINGMRCVALDSVDLCRDYTGRVIEKPNVSSPFSIDIDMGFYNKVSGD